MSASLNVPGRTPVRNIIFDFGDVLLRWDPHAAVSHRLTESEWEQFVERTDFMNLNLLVDGGLPPSELVKQVAQTDPHAAEIIEIYFSRFDKSLAGPVPGTAEVATELRDVGYSLYGLTNWGVETYPHALAAAPLIGDFEGVVVSGREGVIKPDPEIYRILLSRYDLDPAETVFIDDRPPNVAGAENMGMRGILFEDADQLRNDLRAMGVKVSA